MKNTTLIWLLGRIRRRIPALAAITLLNILQALLGVGFALGTRGVIDAAISGNRDTFLSAGLRQGSIILGLVICGTLLRHMRDRLSAQLDRDWKKDLLHGLFHADYAGIARFHSGELLNRLNNDVRLVDEGIISTIPNVAHFVTQLVAAFTVLSTLEPRFALILVTVGALVILVTGFMRRRLKVLNKRVAEEEGRVSGFLQESLEKLLMVQAMDVAGEMELRSGRLMADRFEVQRRRKNVSVFANSAVAVMSYAAGFSSLVWCAAGLMQGRISFGTLTAVNQLVNQLQSPFVSLSGVIPQYISMIASAERLMELEKLCDTSESRPVPPEQFRDIRAIAAEELSFSYDREQIFDGASFRLPQGAFAVITGPSGTGKSTLLKLMLGVFHPEGGKLYLDCGGRQLPLDRDTRKAFSYVPQGNLLLSGTIRDNLILCKPDATEEEIRRAVYISCMDEYLPQLPRGLDTPLGESGAGLSEGQAQRLAIARGIISGAPVLLLDESTSALDARTEQLVLERIRTLPGRTCIIVTHRPAAIALCDWNLEVRNGKILCHRIEKELN